VHQISAFVLSFYSDVRHQIIGKK